MLLSRRLGWIKSILCFRGFVPILAALLFFGAMFWAKGRDPFHQIWFEVKAPGHRKAECVAVLPKMAASPLPVVVYSHGSGGSWLSSGNELRQMAEMGLATVDMDYDQINEPAFEAQFAALLGYVRRQPWADTNRIAWVGFSLGAQRQLAFFLKHPDSRPQLLVRVSGGWVPELEGISDSSLSSLPSVHESEKQAGSLPQVLLLHAEQDEVFPVADARRVRTALEGKGLPVELNIFPGQSHGFEPNRFMLFRGLGEYCLTRLKGPGALAKYQSILSWQAKAKPLWLFWVPAFLWLALKVGVSRRMGSATVSVAPVGVPPTGPSEASFASKSEPYWRAMFSARGRKLRAGRPRSPLRWWEIALRWVAAVLAVAALADTALHLVPPRLVISARTLAIARKHLVQPKESADFEFLASLSSFPSVQAGPSFWRGKPLKTLLEHVELAHYNRELIDWKLDDQIYRDFVLSPQIDPEFDGDLNWRRPLWENFYPRIRKEQTTEDAAVIVARFLRERVTILDGLRGGGSIDIGEIWQRQITDARGFEAVYVAAMRSAGIPARLDARHRAEFWTGSAWRPAPRPVLEAWPVYFRG
jgi:dienelactone hydrolase